MPLRELKLKNKRLFERFLNLKQHELCAYTFENIYIWGGLFEIHWTVIRESLCIFFKDKIGCFLYLPPLSKVKDPQAVSEAFGIMDQFNKNKAISRIENVEKEDLSFYQGLDFEFSPKPSDYLCQRQALAELRGDGFKSKRAVFNYFVKNYNFKYMTYSSEDKNECLSLYREWMSGRQEKKDDKIYRGMLEDNLSALKILLGAYKDLNYIGRVVELDHKIRAFTFGLQLNNETFCVLYEIADLSIRGLAQFIFRSFCSELKQYAYINIMDDSGLENLKKTKLSYRPIKLISNYIIQRTR